MAIVTLDATTTANGVPPLLSGVFAFNATVGTQDDMILIVGISHNASTTVSVSGVTYATVAMTKVDSSTNGACSAEMWYLLNPTVGTNSVSIQFTGNCSSVNGASSYYGVDIDNPLGTSNKANAVSGTPSVTVTSTQDSLVVDTVGELSENITVGGSQTQRWNGTQAIIRGGGSEQADNAGSTVMTWTPASGLSPWGIVAVPIRPKPGNILRMMGFGI